MQIIWGYLKTFFAGVYSSGAIPWIISFAGLSFGVFQWLKNRRRKVIVTISSDKGSGENVYMRWLLVDVTNAGTELNDLNVRLESLDEHKKPIVYSLLHGQDQIIPSFKYAASNRFVIANNDASRDLKELLEPSAKQVAIVVYSHHSEVKRVTSKKWRKELIDFAKADSSLPPRPAPVQHAKVSYPLDFKNKW